MSSRVIGACWDRFPDLTPAGRLVLLALAEHADTDGLCWPSRERIAKMIHVHERQISRAIAALEADELVWRCYQGRKGRSSVYVVLPRIFKRYCERSEIEPALTRHGAKLSETICPPGGWLLAGHSVQLQGDNLSSRLTSIEPRTEPSILAESKNSANGKVSKEQRDALWDALVDVCQLQPERMTTSERADVGKTQRELLEAGASPQQVREVSKLWVGRYRLPAMSIHALRLRWSQMVALGPGKFETPESIQARDAERNRIARELGWIS